MYYKITCNLDYADPDDAIVADSVEADTGDDAIIIALSAISNDLSAIISNWVANHPVELEEYIISSYTAKAIGYSA